MTDECVAVGFIRKPAGLHGWMYAQAYGRILGTLEKGTRVAVGSEKGETATVHIEGCKPTPQGIRLKFEGYETRDEVERFRNNAVYIPQKQLPRLEKDEFYHFDLEGMTVCEERTGKTIGRVRTVLSYPTSDALEIERPGKPVVLIPFKKEFVSRVTTDENRLWIDTDTLGDLLTEM